MDKLLFIARNDILSGMSSTGNKVYTEYKFFSKHFDTYLLSQTNNKILLTHDFRTEVLKECKQKKDVLKEVNRLTVQLANSLKVRFIYFRYPKSNPVYIRTLRQLYNLGCRTIIEFPTFPYDMEIKVYGKSIRDRIIFYVDRIFRNKLRKYTYAAATFSNHTYIFGIPAFQIFNGVIVEEIKKRVPIISEDIHIIAVAQMQRSHGYDRFLYGLVEYYAGNKDKLVFLHLVGDGPEKKTLEEIVLRNNLSKYVIFHGYCVGSELDELYDQCSLALECLGIHRAGLEISSSLKSREYLSKGIPFITSACIDVVEHSFPYVYVVDSTEEAINIDEVISYYDRIYNIPPENVVEKIRDYAKEYCDIDFTLKPVGDHFYA